MSRVLILVTAILAVAFASDDWKDLITSGKKDELMTKISETVRKCTEGSSLDLKVELKKNIADIPREVACSFECFLINGPGMMDKETGKITVPDYFPKEVRDEIKSCNDDLEAKNLTDRCIKALTFQKECMKIFYENRQVADKKE